MKRINKHLFCACFSATLFLFAGQYTHGNPALGEGLFARFVTSRGEIVARLEFQQTPLTVTNFVALAEGTMNAAWGRRFYDGLTFHRVISRANGDAHDFMIQGGCPQGTGMGGPGYRFPDEISPALRHNRPGVLSMANAGPGTNGSQFFITIVPTPHLDGRHTVFGHVVQGQNVVNNIRQGDRIESVTIIRNGAAANAFVANQAAFDRLLAETNRGISERIDAQRNADLALIDTRFPGAQSTESGIRYIVQRQGTGAAPAAGNTVLVNYTGALLSGRVFDSSNIQGRPIEFVVGGGMIIPGWEEMVMGMRVGERRLAVIPPELAYGDRELGGGVIPANSFLVFEMELIAVR
ncbi:MAG: peptidylprolyl isomerase [Spirochaetes bacterium]|nr:peptidylprolyl isomerase [Spirochaetota bacterium]